MKVLDIIPKDIAILNEFSVSDVESLLFCLNHCTIEYDKSDEKEQKYVSYFTDTFYQALLAIEERLSNVN